ncbi:MAG: choice-of-anchor D domain-containing protein [Myxococcota bacterium]|nr:choice-of-anchor D domain-containing protein [Myxococcota bacterium]
MRQILILPALLFGCSENNLHTVTDAGDGIGAAIEVTPSTIFFGELTAEEAHVESFTIMSVGEKTLEVQGIDFGMSNASFAILPNQDLQMMLEPGESQDILVAFQPMGAKEQASTVFVTSNDPINPQASVALIGEGLAPELQISPDPYDFGVTYVGCPNEGDITLTNVGTDPLVIDSIELPSDAFWADTNYSLPLTLQPEEAMDLHVYYDPVDEGVASSTLTVTSNEPLGVREATQMGKGEFAAWYTDEWELMKDPPADIVFLVDQSCSMNDDQSRLASNFSYFISQLNNFTSNWHVMVVNDDNGCTNSGVLKPTTSNYSNLFTNAVRSGGGGYTESLLTVAQRAIQQTNGCNAGFMRSGAMLHMVMVSDEPEQSGGSWSTYVQDLINMKGSAALVRLSAIAGDYPSGCSSAAFGSGYYEAANYTGGAFLSICAGSWASYMSILAATSINQDTFELSAPAAEDTIEVFVNGNLRTNKWYYDETLQAVILEDDIPEGGDKVKIDYAALATCD